MSLSFDFHSSSHADNGNVFQIANNRDGNRTQNFLYDSTAGLGLPNFQHLVLQVSRFFETWGIPPLRPYHTSR